MKGLRPSLLIFDEYTHLMRRDHQADLRFIQALLARCDRASVHSNKVTLSKRERFALKQIADVHIQKPVKRHASKNYTSNMRPILQRCQEIVEARMIADVTRKLAPAKNTTDDLMDATQWAYQYLTQTP